MFESLPSSSRGPSGRRPALLAAAGAHVLILAPILAAQVLAVGALSAPEPPLLAASAPPPMRVELSPAGPLPAPARRIPARKAAAGRPATPPQDQRAAPAAAPLSPAAEMATVAPSAATGSGPGSTHDPDPAPGAAGPGTYPPIDADRIYPADKVEVQPAATDCAAPRYPEAARAIRLEGKVVLSGVIDEEGRVLDVQASGPALLVEAARTAALRCRYRPARIRGRAVRSSLNWVVSFELR